MWDSILKQRKSFTRQPLEITEAQLEQVNTDTGRYYKTPAGELYPSVTTVTGLITKDAIKQWRKAVGEQQANQISSQASRRGTRIHQLCEDYINGSEIDTSKYNINDAVNFKLLKQEIDNNIDNVYVQETRMYSDYLRMAGTVDCIAEWKGKLSVIDFKTARKAKNRNQIDHYFCQATAYAIMCEERFNIPVNRIVLLISVDDDYPQVFEDRRNHYVDKLLQVREQYKQLYGV